LLDWQPGRFKEYFMIKPAKKSSRDCLLPGLLMALLGTACSQTEAPPAVQTDMATGVSILTYMEREAGIDTYPVRILVSPDYVRFDDGYDESDYALLDRRSRTLFSVTHESASILVIENLPVSEAMPADLSLTEERIVDNDAPTIAGKQPQHVEYLANGTPCYQAVSVAGLMGEAVAGMTEYATALGERQLANMQSMPEAMQTPCFLSRYAYASGRHYRHGLPVQLWDESGYYSSLTDFRTGETVSAALFEVPDDYASVQLVQ
ncbi:MAG: hypothetical protein WBP44_13535, partial [Gammaproteobacteria bacterium]